MSLHVLQYINTTKTTTTKKKLAKQKIKGLHIWDLVIMTLRTTITHQQNNKKKMKKRQQFIT